MLDLNKMDKILKDLEDRVNDFDGVKKAKQELQDGLEDLKEEKEKIKSAVASQNKKIAVAEKEIEILRKKSKINTDIAIYVGIV